MAKYQVVVGNVGTIYDGDNPIMARTEYGIMKEASKTPFGRASGEPVTLFCDGEPLHGFEYVPEDRDD